MATRIGIDTGGTFTDVVRLAGRSLQVHKLRSTPADPSRAVLAGLAAVRRGADEAVDLVHGTTVGLNAVLTGNLARTAFVTNRGFEDLIEIGRQERVDLYALAPQRPVPPVPRRLRIGVACRRGPGGVPVERLTREAVDRTVDAVRRQRPQAVAIGLLHSPADPSDEHRLARALRRALPDVPVTCSADLMPSLGEYERFSATILNAAIAPVVGRYTRRIEAELGPGRLRLLRSSLGILPPREAAEYPARAMFSGPAGGVLAAAQVAQRLAMPHAAAFDMGGTSADLCLVGDDAEPSTEGAIAGLPLPLPTVPVHTVGCGGGSIAFADAGGALRVGPESAGADPGPACYGKGTDPTVTDAHVALGHLGAETLLGGAFPIDVDASVRAIERLGKKLGMSARDTARGVLTVADATMARAILVVTAERAIDPARVPLIAFGGAGGLHAATLMQRLDMPAAVMPAHSGAFSAVGLALAGEAVERAEAVHATADRTGLRELIAHGANLLRDARDELAEAGNARRTRTRVDAVARYRGQGGGLVVPLDARLPQRFSALHERRFGFTTDGEVEVVQLRARVELPARPLPPAPRSRATAPPEKRRPPLGGTHLRVFSREHLPEQQPIEGPAVVEEETGTTFVPNGCRLCHSRYGAIVETAAPRRGRRRSTGNP